MAADLSLEDLVLILELQKADIAQLSAARKGKSTSPNQEEVAFDVYHEELARLARLYDDDNIAHSIAAAIATDTPILEALLEEERLAREDHELALRLAADEPDSDDDYAVSYRSAAPSDPIASTSAGPSYLRSLETFSPKETATCVICMEDFKPSETIPVYCSLKHRYCRGCLRDLFLAAAKDESLFPPRCDGSVIPLSFVQPHLSIEELANYRSRMREYSVVDRFYCANASCSAFLGPACPVRVSAQCDRCGQMTCRACKAPWHGAFGLCGASADDEAARVPERDHQCKRCPRCRRMIDLATGCWHVTCRCRHEFCFLCLAQWKTCTCEIWDERRLYREAHRDIAHGEEGGDVDRDDEALDRMLQGIECRHARFRRKGGSRPALAAISSFASAAAVIGEA
ncbi:hypothetical protein JCM10020v2_001684 [Rhodotorula toruloides]